MSISFYCPSCGNFCSVKDEYAGKRAQCQACSQEFIIPSEDGGHIKKIKASRGKPLPGFWSGALAGTVRQFAKPRNITGLIFIFTMMGFKFFIGHADYQICVFFIPIGTMTRFICWGCMCWYFMEIISTVSDEEDELPGIDIGAGFEFLWNVFKSIYLFAAALIIVELPFALASKLLIRNGYDTFFVRYGLLLIGLFCFPMAVLVISVARGLWMVFWPMNIIRPIVRAFPAYVFTAFFVIMTANLHIILLNYAQIEIKSNSAIAMHLGANLAVGLLSIIAMRFVGLLGRHYSCYL
ncbi:MAG: hypothetical protein JW912_02425, partial [Sedimentisphaerales bacterium]|nr:hypothetical protein [Sedimentisphaerales bacterium]